jgi:hypothetical protein
MTGCKSVFSGAVNVSVSCSRFIIAAQNSLMSFISIIYQAIIGLKTISVNHITRVGTTLNNGQQLTDIAMFYTLSPRLSIPKTDVLPRAPRPQIPHTRRAPK